tara:strand:- start:126 stop:323 length:198 start_codon:yes stop_codon:yes gene_type:complete
MFRDVDSVVGFAGGANPSMSRTVAFAVETGRQKAAPASANAAIADFTDVIFMPVIGFPLIFNPAT